MVTAGWSRSKVKGILNMSVEVSVSNVKCTIDRHPDECPICRIKGFPKPIAATREGCFFKADLELAYVCPNSDCCEMFIAYFYMPDHGIKTSNSHIYRFKGARPLQPVPRKFSKFIQDTSNDFCSIAQEAGIAEQYGLTQICGVGYRKALEFLIKDYLIKKRPADAEAIKATLLGKCIENYITDVNTKEVAKRAAWLGNDEVHYERRWIDKDLSDLKRMINLVLHWMEAAHLTEEALVSMPSKV
jgi:hypothetical protein